MATSKKAKTGSPRDSKRTRGSKEERRQQLIEATIDCIAEHGISGTTTTKVTKKAGLSLGLANFYFDDKESLLDATLRYLAEEHRRIWLDLYADNGLSPAARLERIVAAHCDPSLTSSRELSVWFTFYGEPKRRDNYRKIMQDLDPERAEKFVTLIDMIIAEGNYDLDGKQVNETLEALFDGFGLNHLLYPKRFGRQSAHRHLMAYLAAIMPAHFGKDAVSPTTTDMVL